MDTIAVLIRTHSVEIPLKHPMSVAIGLAVCIALLILVSPVFAADTAAAIITAVVGGLALRTGMGAPI